MGVSILVLMEVLREGGCRGLLSHGTPGFNPCFNGSVERGQRGRLDGAPLHAVSILVLMEVLREGDKPAMKKPPKNSFNPCFNGSVERGPEGATT